MEASKTCTHCGSAVAEVRIRRDFRGFCPGCLAREAGLELPNPGRAPLCRSTRRSIVTLALLAGSAVLVAAGVFVLRRNAPIPPETASTPPDAEPAALPAKEARALRGHRGQVVQVSFSPDGTRVASCGDDGAVLLWDVSTGLLQHSLTGPGSGWAKALAWSPRGDVLASGGQGDRPILLWNATTGKPLRELSHSSNGSVGCLSFDPRGTGLASSPKGEGEGRVLLWDLEEGAVRRTLSGPEKPLLRIAFSPEGRHLAAGSVDPSVRIWDVESGRQVWSLRPGCPSGGESVEFSPDGRWIASEREEGVLALWEASTGKLVRVFEGHGKHIHDVAFGPGGSWIATGSGDMTIRIWSTATGRCLRVLEGHRGWVRSLDASKDGLRLASGSADGTVRIWEVPESSPTK